MLSRNEYHGKLPYEEYVRRYVFHQKALPKEERTIPSDIDIPPTTKEIEEYLKSKTETFKSKEKERIKKLLEEQTKTKLTDMNKKLNTLKDKLDEQIGDDTEEKKEHRQNILKGIQLSRSLKPNTTALTPIEQVRAKLIESSKLAYLNDDNFERAQAYIDGDPMLNGYTIDKSLSNKEGVVVRTPNDTTEIFYRGSQLIDNTSFSDIKTNAKIISGFESGDEQFIQAKNQIEKAIDKYGSVEHLSGYSKGGGKSLYLGQQMDIETTNFNPLIGAKSARGITNTNKTHTIIRTTTDPTSLGLAVSSNANHENWNVKALRPLKENITLNPIKNVYNSHKLNNFTKNRNVDNISIEPDVLEQLFIKQMGLSSKKLQYDTLNSIDNYIKNGKSFSDYIFDIQKGSKTNFTGDNDVRLIDGKPLIQGGRHSTKGGAGKFWKRLGGTFTEEEQNIIDRNNKKDNISDYTYEEAVEETKKRGKVYADKVREQAKDNSIDVSDEESSFESIKDIRDRLKMKKDAGIDDLSFNTKLNDTEIESYIKSTPSQRKTIIENHNEEIINNTHTIGEATAPAEVAGFREHLGEAVNPVSMAGGILTGLAVNQALDYVDSPVDEQGRPREQLFTGVSREALEGALTGGITSLGTTALGGESIGLFPEVVAGTAGYVAGSESGKFFGEETKKLGGGEDLQKASADIGGGVVGGGAGALALIGASALTGAELGTLGGPAGIALGMGVGLVGGTIGFGLDELSSHKQEVKADIAKMGDGLVDTGKKIGKFFSGIF